MPAIGHLDQLPGGQNRSYEDIMKVIGNAFDPKVGTDTKAGLESLYGKGNVNASPELFVNYVGTRMDKGKPSLIARDKNHAIVPTQIKVFRRQVGSKMPTTRFSLTYMDPQRGRFQTHRNFKRYRSPTYTRLK